MHCTKTLAVAVLVAGLNGPTAAQNPSKDPEPTQQQAVMPDGEKVVLLVRNTLITLNDAIQTGNFTVLRDKGAPGFRDANSAARLSQSFADLASRGIDLSVVSVITPQISEARILDQPKGMLQLKGYFSSQPVQINFEILYQSVGGRWQLFGLSVQPATSSAPQKGADGETSISRSKKKRGKQ